MNDTRKAGMIAQITECLEELPPSVVDDFGVMVDALVYKYDIEGRLAAEVDIMSEDGQRKTRRAA